jgi:hypothetical protein
VKEFRDALSADREIKVEAARKIGELAECVCCYSDDCLQEEMLACKGGHRFCTNCVQRASDVSRKSSVVA